MFDDEITELYTPRPIYKCPLCGMFIEEVEKLKLNSTISSFTVYFKHPTPMNIHCERLFDAFCEEQRHLLRKLAERTQKRLSEEMWRSH